MANTFFGFDTSLNNGDNLLSTGELEEEEYDALNDETFGALEDDSSLNDWEHQHEQFAEIAESSKHCEQIENSLAQLVLEDTYDPLSKDSVWSFTPPSRNGDGDLFNSSILSSLQKASKSFIESHAESSSKSTLINPVPRSAVTAKPNLRPSPFINPSTSLSSFITSPAPVTSVGPSLVPKKICTVEELEKNLFKTSKPTQNQQGQTHLHQQQANQLQLHGSGQVHKPHPGQIQPLLGHGLQPPPPPPGLPPPHYPHPMFPHPLQQANRGRARGPFPVPLRYLPPGAPHHNVPPGLVRMIPPHPFLQAQHHPAHLNHVYLNNRQQLPVNHPFNLNPPHPVQYQHNANNNPGMNHLSRNQQHFHSHPLNHNPHQQHIVNNNNNARKEGGNFPRQRMDSLSGSEDSHKENRDEYAELMTGREKQWLLNIQMLQLNTGTPYFDDYYYTVFKERKLKGNKDNSPGERNHRFSNNRQRRNSDRQENSNTLTPRVYTPLQFENSLGKLQCGSVTAPRKIIDMDIVTPDKDSDSHIITRDTRKTKQLLLELEALYTLLLKAEDITNPLAISNTEKLREIKQKQRLRELELAPTPEQKQEVLRLFKLESEPVIENQQDYIVKIVQGLLQDDKFTSFMNIRKGRMLLLRLLPHLTVDAFSAQLLDIWSKLLLSMPVTGRRDTAGDNILPRFYPAFKRYVQTCSMSDVLDIVSVLVEVVRLENSSRSTPLSHQGRTPLHFVIQNKLGVSALVTLLIKSEYLISTDKAADKQQNDWYNFVISWSETITAVSKLATPIELLPLQIFTKHCNRITNLTEEKRKLLEKQIANSN